MSPKSPTTKSDSRTSYESHFEHTALFEFSKVINSSLDSKFILSHILLTIMGKILSTKGIAVLLNESGSYCVEMVKGFPLSVQGSNIAVGRIPKDMFYVDKVKQSTHPWIKFFKRTGVKILLPM